MKRRIAAVLCFIIVVCSFGIVMVNNMAYAKTKVKLNKSEITLKVGSSQQLELKNAKGKIKWKSSKKSVATVSKKGIVKAKKAGYTVVTATNKGKSYSCNIIVENGKKADITPTPIVSPTPTVSPAPTSLQEGDTSNKWDIFEYVGMLGDKVWVLWNENNRYFEDKKNLSLINSSGKIIYTVPEECYNVNYLDWYCFDVFPLSVLEFYSKNDNIFLVVDEKGNEVFNSYDGNSDISYKFCRDGDGIIIFSKETMKLTGKSVEYFSLNISTQEISDITPEFVKENNSFKGFAFALYLGEGIFLFKYDTQQFYVYNSRTKNWIDVKKSYSLSDANEGKVVWIYYPRQSTITCDTALYEEIDTAAFSSQATFDACINDTLTNWILIDWDCWAFTKPVTETYPYEIFTYVPSKKSFYYTKGWWKDDAQQIIYFKSYDASEKICSIPVGNSKLLSNGYGFLGDYCGLEFKGSDGRKYYTVMDYKGEFLYEPISEGTINKYLGDEPAYYSRKWYITKTGCMIFGMNGDVQLDKVTGEAYPPFIVIDSGGKIYQVGIDVIDFLNNDHYINRLFFDWSGEGVGIYNDYAIYTSAVDNSLFSGIKKEDHKSFIIGNIKSLESFSSIYK